MLLRSLNAFQALGGKAVFELFFEVGESCAVLAAGDGRGRNYAGVEISICREGLGLVFVQLSRNLRKQDVGGKEHRQQNDDRSEATANHGESRPGLTGDPQPISGPFMRLRCPTYKVTDGSVSKGKELLRVGKSLRKQGL